MKLKTFLMAAALSLTAGGAALAADAIPYPNSGSYNADTYTFTATNSGELIAYFIGGTGAGYENQLGLLVNGVQQGGYGLDNHASTYGAAYSFGNVDAGSVLTFVLHNLDLGGANAYSDPSLNSSYDLPTATVHNHVYSTSFSGDAANGIPAGTYVGFEDIPFPGADYNYDDESFVFGNTSAVISSAPEPGTWALMLGGLGVFGGALRLRKSYREQVDNSEGAAA